MFCCLSVPHLRAIPQLIWFPCHLTGLNWFQIFFPQLSCLVILALVLTTLSFLVWKLSHYIRSEVLFQNHHPENHSVLLIVSSVYEIHQWFRPPAVRLVEISRFDITYSLQAQNTWTKQQTANSKQQVSWTKQHSHESFKMSFSIDLFATFSNHKQIFSVWNIPRQDEVGQSYSTV